MAVEYRSVCLPPVRYRVMFIALCMVASLPIPAIQAQENESGQHEHTNRLVDETSPYLLMHAHNPVNWYPWGEEALTKAREENKVIFLSVGYSSCHWCHVMERESFLDPEIAAYLNEHFICIKVDREERPDIDSIYMTSLHIFNQMTGSGRGGGWPMTMFMTPEAEPFFGGTYFPARDGDRQGSPGFLTLTTQIQKAWNGQRDRIQQNANKLAELTRNELDGRRDQAAGEINPAWIGECLLALEDRFDAAHGGFGFAEANPHRPKFPEASNLFLLLEVCQQSPENTKARTMLETTLDQMFQGGIYDHVGGGFHRYSVDRYWHIPHFEKMLYDNGQLLSVYANAFDLIPKEEYRQVCEEIVTFLLREMTSEEGGFYAALDAESEGEEGKFYRWEKDEVRKVLGEEKYPRYAAIYRLDEAPNFEDSWYAPQLTNTLAEIGSSSNQTASQVRSELRLFNQRLLEIRGQRERPLLDTKILTSWNGLMIRGLADAGRVFEKPDYIEAAERAATFLLEQSYVEGRLRRTYTAGEARLNGYLDDYAFLIDGFIALHQATGNARWLEQADTLQAKQNELFWDEQAGGYFFTSTDHESLLARAKRPADGAIPSGNSVSANNLVYLARELERNEYLEKARRILRGTSSLLDDYPSIAPRLLIPQKELGK